MAERIRPKERERKRPELSHFTYNLSRNLLTKPNGELGRDIPQETLDIFQTGSIADRREFWHEKGISNFGTQMVAWVGKEGKSGLSQWISQQTDDDVVGMLREIGLKSTPDQTKKDLQNDGIVRLVATINENLLQAGQQQISIADLSEDQARSVIFYERYLTNDRGAEDTKSLISTLVAVAERQSNGNTEEAIAKLQKIAPLLSIAGEEAQHALGALLVAKTHAATSPEKLQEYYNPQQIPTEDETRVLEFFQKHRKKEQNVLPLELGKSYDVAQAFATLEPQAVPHGPYWVDEEIPPDFAQKLTPEQLSALQLRKPFFVNVHMEQTPEGPMLYREVNKEVFPQAFALKDDERFANAEALTHDDSGLLALAAVSAATPEKQAELYRQLGETVLRVHESNPQLLGEFLKAQTEESVIILTNYENYRFGKEYIDRLQAIQPQVIEEIKKMLPGVDISSMSALAKLTQEQKEVIQDVSNRLQLPVLRDVLGTIAQYPDRLIAVNTEMGDVNQGLDYSINIPKTTAAWGERVRALSEAFSHDPLTLTPEQIRQVEFLAHSVDTAKVMEMLGAHAVVATPENEISETAPHEEGQVASMTLKALFQRFDNLEATISQTAEVLPPQQELRVIDSTEMAEFSTEKMDIRNLEITQGEGEDKTLAVFTFSENPEGNMVIQYNRDNPFLALLTKEKSIAEYSLAHFQTGSMNQQNTLLAYTLEAASTGEQREMLFKNLFKQIANIYVQHDEARDAMKNYLTFLSEQNGYWNRQTGDHGERLFGSHENTQNRLTELSDLIDHNGELTVADFRDIGMFALPFNLQFVAQLMQEAYRSHAAQEQPSSPEALE